MNITRDQIKAFQKEILDWYKKNKRDLPWRKTRDPYKILVSEIMLQQTQASRVIPKYEAWLVTLPTVQTLANTKTSQVLRLWSGLGYNRRALYLQKCAKTVVEKYDGIFPRDVRELKTLPGIGEYTAAAVACFAFDKQVAVVDTNIRKIIILLCSGRLQKPVSNMEFSEKNQESRIKNQGKDLNSYFLIHNSMPQKSVMTLHDIQKVAQALLPSGMAYEWNQALMDYASAMLKKEKIPLVKQSRFKDSDRFFRGQIIKQLLKQQTMTVEDVLAFFATASEPIEKKRLEIIVSGLLRDSLIQKKGNMLSLAS
jgi:adenine-specific DNA glycosylase